MTNNLHHPRTGINKVFLSLGLGYHQIQFVGLEFLQRDGHQIRVNTWTGSYGLSKVTTSAQQITDVLLEFVYRIKQGQILWVNATPVCTLYNVQVV